MWDVMERGSATLRRRSDREKVSKGQLTRRQMCGVWCVVCGVWRVACDIRRWVSLIFWIFR